MVYYTCIDGEQITWVESCQTHKKPKKKKNHLCYYIKKKDIYALSHHYAHLSKTPLS